MVCVHADWAIGNVEQYRATLHEAASVAVSQHALVTVGIVPSRPDVGFGYIQPGAPVVVAGSSAMVRRVARFVEKPDHTRAEEMVSNGYLWNSGIFAWRVGDLLDEVRAHTPEVQPALDAAGDDLAAFFAQVKSIAIDVGVLERSLGSLVGTMSARGPRCIGYAHTIRRTTPPTGGASRCRRAATWCTPKGQRLCCMA